MWFRMYVTPHKEVIHSYIICVYRCVCVCVCAFVCIGVCIIYDNFFIYFYISCTFLAYRDRQLTINFELWVEIFCVPTCFHVRNQWKGFHEYYTMETQKYDFFKSLKLNFVRAPPRRTLVAPFTKISILF